MVSSISSPCSKMRDAAAWDCMLLCVMVIWGNVLFGPHSVGLILMFWSAYSRFCYSAVLPFHSLDCSTSAVADTPIIFLRYKTSINTDFKSPTVTYQSASPNWMERRSRHRIWLRDLYPYVFCQKYKKKHQMKKHGEFEIYFVNEEGKLPVSLSFPSYPCANQASLLVFLNSVLTSCSRRRIRRRLSGLRRCSPSDRDERRQWSRSEWKQWRRILIWGTWSETLYVWLVLVDDVFAYISFASNADVECICISATVDMGGLGSEFESCVVVFVLGVVHDGNWMIRFQFNSKHAGYSRLWVVLLWFLVVWFG